MTVIKDSTCTFCGCVCDDIDVTVENNHIVEAKRACILGKAWFLNHHADDRASCLIEGTPAPVADGVERAARILTEAKYPIVYGLSDTTSEAQRVAVGIADRIGGTIDTTTSVCHGPSGMAFQGVGEVTCSLGEIANRGDLIIFWGGNPAESHPRHFTKYSLMPKGLFVPNGRKDRTAVGIDVRNTKTAKAMDLFFQIKPRRDFEALWTLRALAKGLVLDAAQVKASAARHLKPAQAVYLVVGDGNAKVIVGVPKKEVDPDTKKERTIWTRDPYLRDGKQLTLREALVELAKTGSVGPGGLVELDVDGKPVK